MGTASDELRKEREAAATRAARQIFDELEEVEALRANLKRWDVPVAEQGQTNEVLPHARRNRLLGRGNGGRKVRAEVGG